jgi:histidinol-phosphate/aromatic aminotransferase/cobyric acid decarboxylase-like protein/GNAT superfamily N-acetyltransferase
MDRPSTVDSHDLVREPQTQSGVAIALADDADRETIYRIRHQVYALELGQHQQNQSARLTDPLDTYNVYLKAVSGGRIVGFVSITPPGHSYSVDKYFARDDFPFPFDDALYEIRLLTVLPSHRFRAFASLLMYAALRWIETQGGTRVVAIGRLEVLSLYEKAGLRSLDRRAQSGAVTYELLTATVPELRQVVERHQRDLRWLERQTDWQLHVPFRAPTSCSHGGAFFAAIGEDFRNLERSHDIINADVLDAWFPPSPHVIAAIAEHLPWLLRTSPPTACSGLVRVIANTRNVRPESIVPAAGSSELIYIALREWLTPRSRVLLLDPSYGEYSHVAEHIVGSRVERLSLRREDGYAPNLSNLAARAASGDYDLVVLVNPNSPTGSHVPRRELEKVLTRFPANTRIWIDETYVEYAGPGESLESFAANSQNAVVCKSMSKVYALSGVRVAYLCAPVPLAEHLRRITPPWAVSLPAQVAAVNALEDSGYYAARYLETHHLREGLASDLRRQGPPQPPISCCAICPPDRLTRPWSATAAAREDFTFALAPRFLLSWETAVCASQSRMLRRIAGSLRSWSGPCSSKTNVRLECQYLKRLYAALRQSPISFRPAPSACSKRRTLWRVCSNS